MIVAFNGIKHSGKSTALEYLRDSCGFVEVSFARPLKDSVAALLGITVEEIEEWKNDPSCTITLTRPNGMRSSQTMREFLQWYGTQAHRDIPEFGRNVWVDMAEAKMDPDGLIVVGDCRFDNEAAVVHRCGGKVIRIVRDEVVTGDEHESEIGISPENIDLELDNNGTIEDLYDRLDLLMNGLVG